MNKNRFTASAEWMLEALKSGKMKAGELTPRQRRVIVTFLVEEQAPMTDVQVGRLIGVSSQQAGRIRNTVLRNASWEITELDVILLGTNLKRLKESLQRKALNPKPTERIIRQETTPGIGPEAPQVQVEEKVVRVEPPDLALVWKIEREYIMTMQDLGFVYRAPEHKVMELPVTSTLTDLMKELVRDGKGIPSRTAFLARLRELASGNGDLGEGVGETRELPVFAGLGDGDGERGSSANG